MMKIEKFENLTVSEQLEIEGGNSSTILSGAKLFDSAMASGVVEGIQEGYILVVDAFARWMDDLID
ncbi:MAG: hypothetical protein R8G66_06295 [Cytophagales bacterium]|nr:hypothetical protein [Cytophagales bacterium]